jgi:hypothetical protein
LNWGVGFGWRPSFLAPLLELEESVRDQRANHENDEADQSHFPRPSLAPLVLLLLLAQPIAGSLMMALTPIKARVVPVLDGMAANEAGFGARGNLAGKLYSVTHWSDSAQAAARVN